MRKGWIVAALALLLIGAGAGWYFESPAWTLKQMADAANARDAGRLSAYVDYPKLRETTKAQIKAAMAARLGSGHAHGFEAVGMMLGMAVADPMIDRMVTPDAIAAMFAADKGRSDAAGAPAGKPFAVDASNAEIVHDGLDRFRLHDRRRPGQDGDLVFERHGLGWKLAQIDVPADVFEERE